MFHAQIPVNICIPPYFAHHAAVMPCRVVMCRSERVTNDTAVTSHLITKQQVSAARVSRSCKALRFQENERFCFWRAEKSSHFCVGVSLLWKNAKF